MHTIKFKAVRESFTRERVNKQLRQTCKETTEMCNETTRNMLLTEINMQTTEANMQTTKVTVNEVTQTNSPCKMLRERSVCECGCGIQRGTNRCAIQVQVWLWIIGKHFRHGFLYCTILWISISIFYMYNIEIHASGVY